MDKALISKEAIQELQKALVPVGQKLGQGGQFVWETYYRQQYVWGFQNALGFIVGIIILIFTYKTVGHMYNKESYNNDEAYFLGFVGGAIGIFFTIACGLEMIGRFVNPNYYIIQDLLNAVK